MVRIQSIIFMLACSSIAAAANAREYYVGGPVHQHDMEIVANYLIGVKMDRMPPDMAHGAEMIHLEADIHATADNVYGYHDGAWVPYLTVEYVVKKKNSEWKTEGKLLPMVAKDGPHYANHVPMNGPGDYTVTYTFRPPVENGFYRHIDKETGVPDWWKPFTQSFDFKYPQK